MSMLFNSKPPLAERLRPVRLDDLVGQEHLVGAKGVIRKTIQSGNIPSMIFWGPPGVGKTTIANIIANEAKKPFYILSAISAGVKDIREIIDKAKSSPRSILFIDEIHRFNKSQQDALLGAVEKGIITLIGATTENPSFEVNSALLSRSQVYTLNALEEKDLLKLVNHALKKDEELKKRDVEVKEHQALFQLSGGDARKVLNLLELVVDSVEEGKVVITDELVTSVAQKKIAIYDKSGEQHYDIISAFIKSIRGSDPNAAIYYLARMVEGGEDVKFIARRMVILASEDIGNANPTALVMANNTFQAVDVIGYPEARIILAQCAVYLASSPKSNASYMAIENAIGKVRETGDLPVPLSVRNAPTKLMKNMGYGKGYQYAHDYEGGFVNMEFLPEKISGEKFYEPGNNPREDELRKYLRSLWKEKYGY
ncbi:MAG TPA: replication-associated recombination protein A [Cyclobacteriaceae bacterium]|nr:replication-associated recombination protein A [Cyclobacteriaceae bacterium]HMV88319.1 replication-associated recombination protein A [Cyclobacteriaceae bacterium]HMX00746.1 replication-associated recombination protein A [Cyclobacteriaceae bacterium]HMX49379.1 replication-associated recombination protein A [Cyclobacteriaceae bacterium]HMY93549.1 replication-associated recombination protein A [Cyclobacteriaceae bacterium]